jgi:hypothetical protein
VRRIFVAGLACAMAAIGLVSCGRGGTSAIPDHGRNAQDRLTAYLGGVEVAYDADSTVTAAHGMVFIRSKLRAAALDLSKLHRLTRTKNGVAADIALGALPVETKFFNKPARTAQDCPVTPQSATHRVHDLCDQPPSDDIFSEMQYATGPGDVIPGRAFGGGRQL